MEAGPDRGTNHGCGGGANEAGPERVRAVEGRVERDVIERTRPRRGQGQRGNQRMGEKCGGGVAREMIPPQQ